MLFNTIKIVFEDEDLLVVDKPAGLVVHGDRRTQEESLSDWLEVSYPQLRDIGRPHTLDNERYEPRYGMLHRLDRGTSGVLVIAKNEKAFEEIHRQFLNSSVQKKYVAVVEGTIKNEIYSLIRAGKIKIIPEGESIIGYSNENHLNIEETEKEYFLIDAPIGRSKIDPRKWTSGSDVRNTKRDAQTVFRIIESLENKTVVEVFPKTGRTHQIRVHFDYLGFPLVGDPLYGEKAEHSKLKAEKIKLHAESITFIFGGARKTFTSELPHGFYNRVSF